MHIQYAPHYLYLLIYPFQDVADASKIILKTTNGCVNYGVETKLTEAGLHQQRSAKPALK